MLNGVLGLLPLTVYHQLAFFQALSGRDLHSLWEQSDDTHARSKIWHESRHGDNEENDMLLDTAPVERVVGIARRLWYQNSLPIMSGLQTMFLSSKFVDVEDVGARVIVYASRVVLRLNFVTKDDSLLIWATC